MSIDERPHFGKATQAFVLLVLARGQSYGYEIGRRLEELGFVDAASDLGALYRLLRELEAAGAIASRWDVGDAGPARRYYALTDQGWDQLRRQAARLGRMKGNIERFLAAFAQLEAERQTAPAPPVPAVVGAVDAPGVAAHDR